MIHSIKTELRKILTIRSTYVILFIALLIEILFAFYATGFKANVHDLHDSGNLAGQVTTIMSLLSTLVALIGVFLVSHEYRYNTILYTLTSARSRTRIFLAKIGAVTLFSLVVLFIFGALAPPLTLLGMHIGGHELVAQNLPYVSVFGRALFVGWGISMFALILTFIIRSQIGSVASIFLIPGTVENLLGLILKNNQVYLPYSALTAVVDSSSISRQRAALVAIIYIVIGWIVAWQLFLRRDAN